MRLYIKVQILPDTESPLRARQTSEIYQHEARWHRIVQNLRVRELVIIVTGCATYVGLTLSSPPIHYRYKHQQHWPAQARQAGSRCVVMSQWSFAWTRPHVDAFVLQLPSANGSRRVANCTACAYQPAAVFRESLTLDHRGVRTEDIVVRPSCADLYATGARNCSHQDTVCCPQD